MAYETVTLTGAYTDLSGMPLQGAVRIKPTVSAVIDSDGNEILAGELVVDLNVDGTFSIDLPATDDANLSPEGWAYSVKVVTGELVKTVILDLPTALGSVDMSDVTPSVAVPVVVQAETVTGAQTKADAAEAAAIAAASADATAKASAAQAAAISAAATDATTKADAAVTTANSYTDTKIAALGTIAYAENATGTTTDFTTTAVAVSGLIVTVPATTRDVWIQWSVVAGISVGGPGTINAILYETTGGGSIQLGSSRVPSAVATGSTALAGSISGAYRVGPVASTRTFQLFGNVYRPSGSLAAYFLNAANETNKSWITAAAR